MIKRTRLCNSPPPQNGGKNCNGNATEEVLSCFEPCPGGKCRMMNLSSGYKDYCTRIKTHKLLRVCKQVVTSLFTSCQQVVFALLVPDLL